MRSAIAPRAAQLHRVEFRAMGSRIGMWLVSDDTEAASGRLGAAWVFMRLVELQLSRFLSDSELSLLNARSGFPAQVSPVLCRRSEPLLTRRGARAACTTPRL